MSTTAPASAPTDVTLTRLNSTSIEVSWTPLSLVDARGLITGYLISHETASIRDKRDSIEVSSTTSSYTITDLTPGTVYGVTVACITEAGVGPVSDVTYEPGTYNHDCIWLKVFILFKNDEHVMHALCV